MGIFYILHLLAALAWAMRVLSPALQSFPPLSSLAGAAAGASRERQRACTYEREIERENM